MAVAPTKPAACCRPTRPGTSPSTRSRGSRAWWGSSIRSPTRSGPGSRQPRSPAGVICAAYPDFSSSCIHHSKGLVVGQAGAGKRGNGEGSVYYDERMKLWRATVQIGGGKRRYISGQTRQFVAQKLTVALREAQEGMMAPASDSRWLSTSTNGWSSRRSHGSRQQHTSPTGTTLTSTSSRRLGRVHSLVCALPKCRGS